jgi:phosphatidate phosphatase APP1
MNRNQTTPCARSQSRKLAQSTALALQTVTRRGWRHLRTWLGLNHPRTLLPYTGYANDTRAWISGRVLADTPPGAPRPEDTRWDNVRSTVRRWHTIEVPSVAVRATLAGLTLTAETDGDGYVHFTFPLAAPLDRDQRWHTVDFTVGVEQQRASRRPPQALHQTGRIFTPDPAADYGIISDLDDTVIHTGMTDWWTATRMTLFQNALLRKPLQGVRELYEAFCAGCHAGGTAANPIFYVSSSAWNLYDLMTDFLAINHIPAGPVLLRDVGFTWRGPKSGWDHKHRTIHAILDAYPDLRFVLVGDSGQNDGPLYVDIARARPAQIAAIYIRNVEPEQWTPRTDRALACVAAAEELGIPGRVVANSVEIAEHAAELGLLEERALADVDADRRADQEVEAGTGPLG